MDKKPMPAGLERRREDYPLIGICLQLDPKLGTGKKREQTLHELWDKSGKSDFLKGIFLIKLLFSVLTECFIEAL